MRSPHIGHGSNSANLRLYNERLLLQALRRSQPTAKADLARQANLTSTAVGSIIASLEEAGLIEHTGRRLEGQRGQPASLIRLEPARRVWHWRAARPDQHRNRAGEFCRRGPGAQRATTWCSPTPTKS